MKSEITVSEIYQTSTTTEPNKWQLTVVATGSKEHIINYAKNIGLLPLKCLASPCPCTAVKMNQCNEWRRVYPPDAEKTRR